MFYGWGKSTDNWPLADGNTVVCSYSYFSLMFIFQVMFNKKWYVMGDQRSLDREMTRAELEAAYGEDVPKPGIWRQYGLLLTIAAIVVFTMVSSLF